MTVAAVEFLRRFLLHVLPRGFMKIRHYGFMANCFRGSKLALLRDLLDVMVEQTAGHETFGQIKKARGGNATPRAILARVACLAASNGVRRISIVGL